MTTAEITSYSEAIQVVRQRLGERFNIRYEDFDTLCQFPDGLTGKCLGPAQVKRFGIEKFFDALRGAGLRIRLEEDPEQTAKMIERISNNFLPRQANQARQNNHASTISTHILSRAFGHILRKARKARWDGKTPAERSQHASDIANARWKRHRKRVKAGLKAARTRKQRLRLEGKAE
jgi:hypothetical protein